MNAQNKIPGVFNAVSKIFETDDKTYWIDFFENDVARIYKDGYVGLIDSTGTIICKPKYDAIFNLENGTYRVSLNNKYGLMDKNGNEIQKLSKINSDQVTSLQQDKYVEDSYKTDKYDFNEKLKNGFKIVGKEIGDSLNIKALAVPQRLPKKKYLKGIVNSNDELIVPIIYNDIINKGTNLFAVLVNEKYGAIDLKNNIVFPIGYDYIQIGTGIVVLSKRNNLGELESGVFDFFGKELIPYSKFFYQIIDGNRLLKEESGSVRFVIDRKGNKINTN